MRRHLLIGRFGSADNIKSISVPQTVDETVSELNLVSDKIGQNGRVLLNRNIDVVLEGMKDLNLIPTEIGVDMLIVALHVYAADTRLSRRTESQDMWTREIRLIIPVSDKKKWMELKKILEQLLNFLTGDFWLVDFRQRPKEYERLVSEELPFEHPFDGVGLFSGGLDSLIGTIDSLSLSKTPLLVSHAGDRFASKPQKDCFRDIKEEFKKSDFERLRTWIHFGESPFANIERENTTRGRSFLFFALGVMAGTALNKKFILSIPENGFISLNVPLDPLRLGALSTRTTHPFYIQQWNEMLGSLGISGKLENPYWNKTKGEMIRECKNMPLLKKILPLSVSCSHPHSWKPKNKKNHCGRCFPCIIRRAALHEARIGETNDYISKDLKSKPLSSTNAIGADIRSLQFAINQIQENPEIARTFIRKPGPLTDGLHDLDELSGVYKRGLEEISRFLSGVNTKPKK